MARRGRRRSYIFCSGNGLIKVTGRRTYGCLLKFITNHLQSQRGRGRGLGNGVIKAWEQVSAASASEAGPAMWVETATAPCSTLNSPRALGPPGQGIAQCSPLLVTWKPPLSCPVPRRSLSHLAHSCPSQYHCPRQLAPPLT